MASFVKFNQFIADLGLGVHNLNTGAMKIALTNTAPTVATDATLANITQIAAANGYTSGGTAVGSTAYSQTSGTGKLTGNDVVFTASGGSIGPFRYAVLYNDTPTSPADPLIGYWDYGTANTVTDGNTFTVDFSATNGLLQIA